MANSWIVVTSDMIELENMKFGGAHNGAIIYTPQENAVVRVGDKEYHLEKGAKYIVL